MTMATMDDSKTSQMRRSSIWRERLNLSLILTLTCGLSLSSFIGCVQTNMTNPARSATEQLLLSTAADRAMQSVDLTTFARKKVFLDTNFFDTYDVKNAIGTIRDALNRAGALLVSGAPNADYIIEARSGALSIDYSQTLIGLPNTAVPVPLAGTFAIPEIALYKNESQYSLAKVALLAYARPTGEHYFSSGPMVGRSYNKYYKFLGIIAWTRTDLPEKHKPKHHWW